jgi:hypothetical protein
MPTAKAIRRLKNQLDFYPMDTNAKGLVRIFSFDPKTGKIKSIIEKQNLILYSGADVMAKCLSGNSNYAISSMFMEFKNLPSPSDSITPPAFDRTGGIGYYSGLSSSLDTDYVRVPLVSMPDFDTSDALYYNFNQATYFAISEGSTGVHGKTFGPGTNSAVYGAALVATPEPAQPAQDVVFSRVYSGVGKILKEAGFEIGITWTIRMN